MTDLAALLWGIVVLRPYVFAFLVWAAYALSLALTRPRGEGAAPGGAGGFLMGAAPWFAVAAFNLAITFAIGETALGLVGLAVAGTLAAALSLPKGAPRMVVPAPGRVARAQHEEMLPS